MCQWFFFFWLNIWGSNEQLVNIISIFFFLKHDLMYFCWFGTSQLRFVSWRMATSPSFAFFPPQLPNKRAEVHTLSSVGWTLNKCCVVKYKFLPLGPFRCVGWGPGPSASKVRIWKGGRWRPQVQKSFSPPASCWWQRTNTGCEVVCFFCFCLAGCLEYLKTPFVSWLGVNTTLGHRDSVMGTPCVNRKKTPTSTMEKLQTGLVFRFALGFRLYLLPMIGNLQLPPAIM